MLATAGLSLRMSRMSDAGRKDALSQLISLELQAQERANKQCWGVFASFVTAMGALVGVFAVVDQTSRVVLCFVAMASVVGWAELQIRALHNLDIHEDRLDHLQTEHAIHARFLSVPQRRERMLIRGRPVRACEVITWAPSVSFLGWLFALFQLSR
jgi:hypothetical protein